MFKLIDDNKWHVDYDDIVKWIYVILLIILLVVCIPGFLVTVLEQETYELAYLSWLKWFFIIWGGLELIRIIIFDIWLKKECWNEINRPYQLFLVFVPLSFSIINYFLIGWKVLKWCGGLFKGFIGLFKDRVKVIESKTKEIKEENLRLKQEKEKLKKEKGMLSVSENVTNGEISLAE